MAWRGEVGDDPRGMAPRPIESRDALIARLRAAGERTIDQPLRFGGRHFTHAVVVEHGAWQVRRLRLERAKAEAYLAEHGRFMPEHAEMLSEPGPDIVLTAASLEGLIAAIQAVAWPLL